MPIEEDIARIVAQETTLTLPEFGPEVAWQLGTTLRELAVARKLSILTRRHCAHFVRSEPAYRPSL